MGRNCGQYWWGEERFGCRVVSPGKSNPEHEPRNRDVVGNPRTPPEPGQTSEQGRSCELAFSKVTDQDLGMKIPEGGDNITPIKAVLIRHTRLQFADGGLIEVKW
jgi:hypothetical protein